MTVTSQSQQEVQQVEAQALQRPKKQYHQRQQQQQPPKSQQSRLMTLAKSLAAF